MFHIKSFSLTASSFLPFEVLSFLRLGPICARGTFRWSKLDAKVHLANSYALSMSVHALAPVITALPARQPKTKCHEFWSLAHWCWSEIMLQSRDNRKYVILMQICALPKLNHALLHLSRRCRMINVPDDGLPQISLWRQASSLQIRVCVCVCVCAFACACVHERACACACAYVCTKIVCGTHRIVVVTRFNQAWKSGFRQPAAPAYSSLRNGTGMLQTCLFLRMSSSPGRGREGARVCTRACACACKIASSNLGRYHQNA